tara:strand:- start:383 stop:766 length:384 start_codon:yes stop_codon:yes gene_type:complete
MAHYAKVNNTIVEQIIVAEPEFFDTFIDSSPGAWVQTSYNTKGGVHYEPNSNTASSDQSKALRKNYAVIGGYYDGVGFHDAQPFASWTLNSTTYYWEPPVTYPSDGKSYVWNESVYQADNTKGWVLV